MTNTQTVLAHAKINLVLRILAREASGFHSIETLFQRLALHDVVTVTIGGDERTLVCEGPSMPPDGFGELLDNLAYRAAVAYTHATQWDTGWTITIDKRIPVGGGMGGGSADAAAVLRALESMAPHPLGMPSLLALGGTLGADVPFLLSENALAWAWGRGDRFLALPALPVAHVELYAFTDGVHTGAAYAEWAEWRRVQREAPTEVRAPEEDGATENALNRFPSGGAHAYAVNAFAQWEHIARVTENDFEQVVPGLHAGVKLLLPRLRARAVGIRDTGHAAIALMSGSGATCIIVHTGVAQPAVDAVELPDGCTLMHSSTL